MKFTIRDLFLVTMIVALAVGWWLDRSRLASSRSAVERDAHDLGKLVDPFDRELPDERIKELQRKYFPFMAPYSSAPAPMPPKP